MDEIVERALRRGAVWDEVKDRLKTNAFGMSGGQQQRLCIARCLAVEPDVILMDEPCSALDPISTGKIEDLMIELKQEYSIVIVTHNMQQAARVSDKTAFFTVELDEDEKNRTGRVVEFDDTETIFTNPVRSPDRGLCDREGRVGAVVGDHQNPLPGRARGIRAVSARRPGARGIARSTARWKPSRTRTSSSRAWSSPTTTASTAATSRCTRGSCRCSPSRRRWPATCGVVAALLHVIKHVERMGDQCVNMAKLVPLDGHQPPADPPMLELIQRMGDQARQQVVQCGQAFERRDVETGTGPGSPGRRDRPPQPPGLPHRPRARRRGRQARMGDAHDARGPLHRADRRQRGGHRRADRLRRHGPVPGVRGRLAPSRARPPLLDLRLHRHRQQHDAAAGGGCGRGPAARAGGAARVHADRQEPSGRRR